MFQVRARQQHVRHANYCRLQVVGEAGTEVCYFLAR